MRYKIVAGNWKMNTNLDEAKKLIADIQKNVSNVKMGQLNIIAVPFPFIPIALELTQGNKSLEIAAQNCAAHAKGAYTGEVSADMLQSMGVKYCIVGHSERRTIFKENSFDIQQKVELLQANKIVPIWCCGESLEERNHNQHFSVIKEQLQSELFSLSSLDVEQIIVAYEPVWAIGTGLTASPEQAQEMHEFIRTEIAKKYDQNTSNAISILYGGSCNADNANTLFSLPDVDGGLIGGASLKADSFAKLISTMHELH